MGWGEKDPALRRQQVLDVRPEGSPPTACACQRTVAGLTGLVLLTGSGGPVRPPAFYNLDLGSSQQNWSWVFVGSALLQRRAWVVGMDGAVLARVGWQYNVRQWFGRLLSGARVLAPLLADCVPVNGR